MMRLFWREGVGGSEVGPPGMVPRGWTRDVGSAETRGEGVEMEVGPKVAIALGVTTILGLVGYGVYRASR